MRLAITIFLTSSGAFAGTASEPSSWFQILGGHWTVSNPVAAKAFEQLDIKFHQEIHPKGGKGQRLEKYTIQYKGITSRGSRFVKIQGLCLDLMPIAKDRIKTEWLAVSDGGSCVFNAQYDLKKQRIVNFFFNGLA